MRARCLALALVVLVGAAACEAGGAPGGPSGTETPPGQLAHRSGPPTGVDATPIMTGQGNAALTDELLIKSDAADGSCSLKAIDLADGRTVRWVFAEADGARLTCFDHPIIAGSTVVASYVKETPAQGIQPATYERGLAGIGLDGTLRWRAPAGAVNQVVAANERFAVGWAYTNYSPGTNEPKPSPIIEVVDVASGAVLWQRPDLSAVGLDGDLVYAVDTKALNLIAFDASTGNQRWSLPHVVDHRVSFVGAGVVTIVTSRPRPSSTRLDYGLAIHDGRTGALRYEDLDSLEGHYCVSDGKPLLVCVANGKVFAYDLVAGARTWVIPAAQARATETQPRCIVDGRLFVSTSSGGAILDAATGKQLVANLPAAPTEVRGAYGLVAVRLSYKYEVYRITG